MATTEVIQPIKRLLITQDNERHNVCAYCRVSTDETDQKNSLVSQQRFFESYFRRHPNWNNVGIFADEGLSGTSYEKRIQFNKMLTLARHGGVDIILTKEVSRFSRNTQDFLNIVEELRELGVYIWFLSDDIITESNDYRERLTQLAANAEQESLRTSRRVKWGQLQQMERGRVFGRKEMYGYHIVTDELGEQHFVIIPEEAEIIKQIYYWFSMGDGTCRIGKRLKQMGAQTPKYKNGWSSTVILRILRNEKYVGDLIQGKTYTPNALTHKKKYNRGDSPMVCIRDHHPEAAIIDRGVWEKVQRILQANAVGTEAKAKHTNRYWASGRIFCGCCGGRYVRYSKKQLSAPYRSWVCIQNHRRGRQKQIELDTGETSVVGCNGLRVNDRVLKCALHDIITEIILPRKQEIIDGLLDEHRSAAEPQKKEITVMERKIERKQQELTKLTTKYLQGIIPEEAYTATATAYQDLIRELRTELTGLEKECRNVLDEKENGEFIKQVEAIVGLQEDSVNEGLFERVTGKIIVHPQKVLEIHLSFLSKPIYLRYATSGRGRTFDSVFTIISGKK